MPYHDYQSDYGVYHSVYDSFDWMVNECDPEFKYHQAMTRLWLIMAYELASSKVLPFAMIDQAEVLVGQISNNVNDDDAAQIRSINKRLATCERKFLGAGLPHRPWFKHLLQAPGMYLGYGSRAFPGIADALDARDRTTAVEQVKIAGDALERAAECLLNGFVAEEDVADAHEIEDLI